MLKQQTAWYGTALGTKLNPDLSFGMQCVDAVDHYAQFIFGVPWQTCVGSVNGAKELYAKAPTKYWTKIKNDITKPNLLPAKGDVLVLDGWPGNEFGHTGAVFAATAETFTLYQQDGFAPPLKFVNGGWYSDKPTHKATYRWVDFPGVAIGWLRPKPALIIGSTVKEPAPVAALWMPTAVRKPQPLGVTLDKTLPPRATWHITWDKLGAKGQQPAFSAVANYLIGQKYCPHIMWNPVTGYIEQYYPANVGGRALAAWNEDGKVNIQIEVFFSPGEVVEGKKYMTVAETPCKNLDKIVAWLRSHGIADKWPMGMPKWQGSPRTVDVWNTKSGHYGHCHVPDNTHTDPGPMPDLFKAANLGNAGTVTPVKPAPKPTPKPTPADELEKIMGWYKDRAEFEAAITRLPHTYRGTDRKDPKKKDARDAYAYERETANDVIQGLLNYAGTTRTDRTLYALMIDAGLNATAARSLASDILAGQSALNAQIGGLVEAIGKLAAGGQFDEADLLAKVQAASAEGIRKSIASITQTTTAEIKENES